MVDENTKLFVLQQQLEKDAEGRINFFGLSVNETIRTCLVNGIPKKADNVKDSFKVPDKRYAITSLDILVSADDGPSFWYIKLYALTSIRDFEGLEAFAKSKRSPIGYEAFVRHLIEKGHPKEAATFVTRCDSNKRVDLYVDCGDWRAAGKECKERGDKGKMECDLTPLLRPNSLTKVLSQSTPKELPQLLDRQGVRPTCDQHEMTRIWNIYSDTTRSVFAFTL